jgi:hypothetical protein
MTPRHRWIAGCLAATAALAPVALAVGAPPAKGPVKNLNACEGGVKIEPVVDGTYQRTLDGVPLTITLDVDEASQAIAFRVAGGGVTSVKVKGGPDPAGAVYDYAGGATGGEGLTAPRNPRSGSVYGLSHVCFFSDGDVEPPPEFLVPPPPAEVEEPPVVEEEPGAPVEDPPTGVLAF